MRFFKAESIVDYVRKKSGNKSQLEQATQTNLALYAEQVVDDPRYHKNRFPFDNIKTERDLPVFDCTWAPCVSTCPTEQNIPAYIGYTATGDFEEAHRVILETNPFPNLQGQVCHHPCHSKCTRINLDDPLKIREIKRFVAEQNGTDSTASKKDPNGLRSAIIGAGPSGLSAAYFLALEGFAVEIYEAKPRAGGMAADAIPEFRLDPQSLEKDIKRIKSLGVKIHTKAGINKNKFADLCQNNNFVYIAVGAQSSLKLGITGEEAQGVLDQLDFLSQVRQGKPPQLGSKVAVIGAGNSAMDAARTAKRLVGKEGEVTILYRRTRKEMPAELEEISEAIVEGVIVVELVAPETIIVQNGQVTGIECAKMELGEKDASGRRRPVKIADSVQTYAVDTVIPAIGQRVKLDFFPAAELLINPDTHETQLENVFAGGDAVRGASTLIDAIADGRHVAENIIKSALGSLETKPVKKRPTYTLSEYHQKLAHRTPGLAPHQINPDFLGFDLITETLTAEEAKTEAERCLSCDLYCSICTTVCPNRANVAFKSEALELPLQIAEIVEGQQRITEAGNLEIVEPLQILNIGDFCNECGNCTSFCPTNGSPYQTKPRFCLTRESFAKEENAFYLEHFTLFAKNKEKESRISLENDFLNYNDSEIFAELDAKTYECVQFEFKNKNLSRFFLKEVAIMGMLLNSLKNSYLFNH